MEVFVRFLLGLFLSLTAFFLILLVLIQRGRGGGLAGALGGMGGQSAFGTKAGDFFTKFTVGVAAVWILLCILAINVLGRQRTLFSSDLGGAAPQAVAPIAPPQGGAAAPAQPAPPQGDEPAPVTDAAAPAPAAPAASDAPAAPAASAAAEPPATPAEPAPAN